MTRFIGRSSPTIEIASGSVNTIHMAEEYNKTLAGIFQKMSDCYRYLGTDERFRAIAYANAARSVRALKQDISYYASDIKTLDKIRGIGESIAEKIMEFLKTGKIKTFEVLKKSVPFELLELMNITGMGPATIRALHEKLQINDINDLVSAIQKGRLRELPGLGEKKILNIERALKLRKEKGNRMLLGDALDTGNSLVTAIRSMKGVLRAELAGSLRRMKETIGDIDIIIAVRTGFGNRIVKNFTALPAVSEVIVAGATKASVRLGSPDIQVDIRIVNEDEYGSALLYFTGSKEHNIRLRTLAKEKGLKINEYGLYEMTTGRRIAGETENSIYRILGMEFIEPEMREDGGEMDAATAGQLPTLVRLDDIRGDMQMHSTWSDGAEDIYTMAQHILLHHPEYEYIVMTDHSPSERIAGGMLPSGFKKQFSEIDRVNRELKRELVRKGVEVDILVDGSLDLPDDLLASFEWVTASVHSGFSHDNTDRLLKACEHPLVNCIGHPSGRLIGRREPYKVDWSLLFKKAAQTGTALEINAQQERLDLSDQLIREAINTGVKLTISTDAHSVSQYGLMKLGIGLARRGWCSKSNILNTKSWKSLETFRNVKRASRN